MITSSSNTKVKQVIQLNTKAKARRESGCFVAEGYKLFCETPEPLRRAVFMSETFAKEHPELAGGCMGEQVYRDSRDKGDCGNRPDAQSSRVQVEITADAVFRNMCDTKTPQGILTVASMPAWSREDLLGYCADEPEQEHIRRPLILVLEDLQDPGNVGTIIRTAEGAGVTGIVVSSGTADVFSPKVIRATMGSIFRVPVVREMDLPETLSWLQGNNIRSFASHLAGSAVFTEEDYRGGTAFLIGNEGNGLSDTLTALADRRIRIPMEGQVESLNASIAAAVMMYEARRQRRQRYEAKR